MNIDHNECANLIKQLFGAQKADFTGIKIGFCLFMSKGEINFHYNYIQLLLLNQRHFLESLRSIEYLNEKKTGICS